MYAVRKLDRVRETSAVREEYAGRRIYAEQAVAHRWQTLVRERAVERWGAAGPRHTKIASLEREADPLPAPDPHHDPHPDPDPDDELYRLGERCAEAYIQADALHYQAMTLLADFHRRRGWQDTGFSSTAEWLAWRIGIQAGAARERLRTALALEQLPEASEAMRTGQLSFTKARALTRVATPETETTLLDLALAGSAANLERVVRGWKTLDRKSEVTAEQIRHRSRRFSAWVEDDGMVVVKGRLDPEVGALLMRAVEAASDALYRGEAGVSAETSKKERGGELGPRGAQVGQDPSEEEASTDLETTQPEQRRADAVGLLAERALAAGFGGWSDQGKGKGTEPGSGGNDDGQPPISGSRAERYQVMLHVDAGTLEEDGDPGQSELEDGTRVSAETSRRISCDAGLVAIGHAPDGQVVGAGRRKRTVSPPLRRALEARDRGCRFPGCGLRFTDAHHVKHWADGGETTLRNLVLLCRRHHRAVHEGGVRVCIDTNGQVVFFTPRGKALMGAPPVAVGAPPVGAREPELVGMPVNGKLAEIGAKVGAENGAGGGSEAGSEPWAEAIEQIRHDPLPGAPRWKRDRDIPWGLEARAWEALDSG